MKKLICIFSSIFILTSCHDKSNDFYDQKEFDQLLSSPEYKILDTIKREKSEIFVIYQDEGALGGRKFYLLHKIGGSEFHHILYPDNDENIIKLENKIN